MKKLYMTIIILNIVTLVAGDTTAMLPPKLLNKDYSVIDVTNTTNDFTITSGNASPAQCIVQAYNELQIDPNRYGPNHYIANFSDTILEVRYTLSGIDKVETFKVNAGQMYALYTKKAYGVKSIWIYSEGSNYVDSGGIKKQTSFARQQYPNGVLSVIFKNGKQQYTIGAYELENFTKLETTEN